MHLRMSGKALCRMLAAMLSLGVATSAAAQATGTLRGRVTEAASQRGVGDAQVMIVGSALGALTNANGDYLIANVPVGTRTVRVRRLGFTAADRPATINAGSDTRLDITLNQSATQLEQLVVTGTAGAAEKRTVGNSITQLNVAEITEKTSILNVSEVLQSKTPGVTLLPGSGAPGTAGEFRIRGAGSLSGYKPVVFIDGVRYNIEALGTFPATGAGQAGLAQSSQVTSALDFLNPDDIESIEVLKGPAASTLYGADAANGVIQIITKKGSRGQQKLNWNVRAERAMSEWVLRPPDNFTTCDTIKTRVPANRIVWPGCQGVPEFTVLSDNPLMEDPKALREGEISKVGVNLRGGGDQYSYFLSGERDSEQGFFYNSDAARKSVRSNFTFSPNAQSDISVNMNWQQNRLRLPIQDESLNGLLLSSVRGRPGRISPFVTVADSSLREGWRTILPDRANAYKNFTDGERLTLGGTLNFTPFPWFRNRFTAGIDNTTSQAELLFLPGDEGEPGGADLQRYPITRLVTVDYSGSLLKTFFKNFETTTSVGAQVIASRTETLSATGTGLGAPDVTLIGSAQTTSGSNGFSENNSVGYYVQEQIGWNNRLFVTGAVRADDNSSFGTNFDVIVYPKASLSWVLSEEPALTSLFNAAKINSFKFRTAWGQAGRSPAPYSAIQTYTVDKVTLGAATGSAVRTFQYGNPDLKAEKGEEIEIGFDAGLFQERIGVDFTYYDKTTSNILQSIAVAQSTGFPVSRVQNLGEVNNKGIELAVFGTPIQLNDFQWDTRVNMATNKNELVSFGIAGKTRETPIGQAYGAVQQHRVGYPLGGYWAQNPQRNADGSPVLNTAGAVQFDTAVYIGPPAPKREFGFSNTFTLFRNFRVYALLDYKGGHSIFNLKERNRCQGQDNCWLTNDPRARNPQTPADTLLTKELAVYRSGTTAAYWIQEADFVKLREVSLTVSLPPRWAALAKTQSASVVLSGRNLALWSDYPGIDPEVSSYGGRNFVRADSYASPAARRVSASLNLTF